MELISKSIAPFADLQKGDNKIDIDKLKQNIKDILTTSLVLMGAVGVAQDPKSAKFAETYFGKDAWLMNAYHIENGVNALKAGTDGLEFISKASDMAKKVSDSSKDLNFYTLQEQVKSIIITSMSFISALGAGQNNKEVVEKYLGEDAVLFTIDNIKKGEDILNQSKTSMESLINLSDIVNSDKLNIANWEQKKNVIKELIYSPIDTMGKLLQTYKYDDVVKWFNYLLPMISGKIEEMFKMLDNDYDGTLGKLNLDLKFFYKEIVNQNIEAKKMDNLDKIVKFFERWAK